MKHNYITFDQAVLLKKCGFNEYTQYCIQKYTSDFIYDEDPDHPESHKKGDIRVYNFTYDPKNPQRSLYPMITVAEAFEWLRKQEIPYLLTVAPKEDNPSDWNAVIYKKDKSGNWFNYKSYYIPGVSYDEASEYLLSNALTLYKNELRRAKKSSNNV